MRLLGIRRGAKYSPNLVDSDTAIFNRVTERLIEMGHEVDVMNEDGMRTAEYSKYDRIYGMERDNGNIMAAMNRLQGTAPIAFTNSLKGITACTSKGTICVKMEETDVPQPKYIYYIDGKAQNINGKAPSHTNEDWHTACKGEAKRQPTSCHNVLPLPVWMKNSDSSAVTSADTAYCATEAERVSAIADFKKRGVRAWVEQKHLAGDLIKFYGVEGTDFFHWQYASHGHSKFGLESINGKEKGYPFNAAAIKSAIDRLASSIDVPIYGGDAIIDADGHFWIIDFNDFPSFSSCREEASRAIAQRIAK